jgi:hypothetical protein
VEYQRGAGGLFTPKESFQPNTVLDTRFQFVFDCHSSPVVPEDLDCFAGRPDGAVVRTDRARPALRRRAEDSRAPGRCGSRGTAP